MCSKDFKLDNGRQRINIIAMKLPQRRRQIIQTPLQFKRIKDEGQGAYSNVDQVIDPLTRKAYALKMVV